MTDNWISVEDKPLPDSGDYLVVVENERHPFHVAQCHPNITSIGGHFSFDMPPVTHWQPLPPPPNKGE